MPEAKALFGQRGSLIKKIGSQEALVDLKAQRRLLALFLDWLADDLDGYGEAHKSFFGGTEPPKERIKNALALLEIKNKVDEMSLDDINAYLSEVRQTISEIDGFWSELSDMMEYEAATR
jgi:hypothetical protein